MNGRKGRRGLHSVWYFLISWREDRELDFGFLLWAGFCLSIWWYSYLGHLVAAVGALGLALVGARPATACLASRRGWIGVSATVSDVTVDGSTTLFDAGSLRAGGFSCRSWTRSTSPSMSCRGPAQILYSAWRPLFLVGAQLLPARRGSAVSSLLWNRSLLQ